MFDKIVAIDIDDTILPRGGALSERTKAAVARARAEGVCVVIATGRGYHGSSGVLRELDADGLVINYGGAMINEAKTGRPFFVTELESSVVTEILELAEERGLHAHLYQGDEIVYEYENERGYGRAYAKHLDLPSRIEPNIRKMQWHNVPKVLIITEPERVPELLGFFTQKLRGKASVSASSPGFIEFNKIGASKGSALELIAAHYGVPRERTYAIGDNTLDLEMIRAAGTGCCVEDGNESVKASADVIAPACRDDGAAWFIEECVLKNRRPSMLSIGFDIGGTTIKAGAVNEDYEIVKKTVRPTPFGSAEALVAVMRDMADELVGKEAVCSTVGVTVPGSIGSEGNIIDAWNIGLHDVPLRSMAAKSIPAKRVIVKNDADAAAYAELRFGALKGVENGLMLTLGTGVGGSIIIGGELFRGGQGRGTELGHAIMARGGLKCGCGHNGCIETLCSATALKRLAQSAAENGRGLIAEMAKKGAEVDAKLAIDCAMAQDETAISLLEEYTDALADAIASFVNVLDPEVIVLGGGVSGAGDFLLDMLRAKIPPRTFFGSCGRLAAASAGNDAGLLGSLI